MLYQKWEYAQMWRSAIILGSFEGYDAALDYYLGLLNTAASDLGYRRRCNPPNTLVSPYLEFNRANNR